MSAGQSESAADGVDRSDAIIVRWDPPQAPPRRLRFEPRDDGWTRFEEVWTGCLWRVVGSERVDKVTVNSPAEVTA